MASDDREDGDISWFGSGEFPRVSFAPPPNNPTGELQTLEESMRASQSTQDAAVLVNTLTPWLSFQDKYECRTTFHLKIIGFPKGISPPEKVTIPFYLLAKYSGRFRNLPLHKLRGKTSLHVNWHEIMERFPLESDRWEWELAKCFFEWVKTGKILIDTGVVNTEAIPGARMELFHESIDAPAFYMAYSKKKDYKRKERENARVEDCGCADGGAFCECTADGTGIDYQASGLDF